MDTSLLQAIHRAAQKRAHAEALKREATRELHNYCSIARAGGVPDEDIAEAAGISHHDLHKLMADRALDQD